jgi:hypothetical protein
VKNEDHDIAREQHETNEQQEKASRQAHTQETAKLTRKTEQENTNGNV